MTTWIGTVSGLKFDYMDPQPESIGIADIATGLSNICRFAGQLDRFYSVAQHSVMVARTVLDETDDPVIALQGLLHDGSEAYTSDCPSPLKNLLAHSWKGIENIIQSAIYKKFGVPTLMHFHVKEADTRWLITEREQLQRKGPSWENTKCADVVPYGHTIDPLPPQYAREAFLGMYLVLSEKVDRLASV